jgi:L-asparaginase
MEKRLITTGGTIDKVYIPATGEMSFNGSNIPSMLKQSRLNFNDLTVEELMQLDSLDMTDEHRNVIAMSCAKAPETSIIITHGTDTMPETARYIQEDLRRTIGDKTIVLTGAMIPHSLKNSDALFNLGSAFAHVEVLPPGVYISMNGRAFNAETVRKNKELGIFEQKVKM